MLQTAMCVPDHGRLNPWRFLRISGKHRAALGELLAARRRELEPDAALAVIDKDRARFNHAPLIVAVVACLIPGHKVPTQEQLLSAGCVCLTLLHAAQALGFGAQWLTGWAAYDATIMRQLKLDTDERIVGFIHIGTPRGAAPERTRPELGQHLSDWVP
jgi:nitroreductase